VFFSNRDILCAIFGCLTLGLSGCWTGNLIEWGRRHSTVVDYSRVASDGKSLRVDYFLAPERSGKPDARRHSEKAAGELPFSFLLDSPPPSVEQLDVEWETSSGWSESGVPLALNFSSLPATFTAVEWHNLLGADVRRKLQRGELEVWVETSPEGPGGKRPSGFRLCSSNGETCYLQVISGSFAKERISPWVYIFAPVTAAVDLSLLPIQIATLPILLVLSD
jgi:hypothetical protein